MSLTMATHSLEDTSHCRRLSSIAVLAVRSLWDDERRTFWRSTEHRERESASAGPDRLFPTVTFTCIEALLDALARKPEWLDGPTTSLIRERLIPRLLEVNSDGIVSTLLADTIPDPHGQPNPFTLARFVRALAMTASCPLASSEQQTQARTNLAHSVGDLVGELTSSGGLLDDSTHPFLLFHAARALQYASAADASTQVAANAALGGILKNVRGSAEVLLANHELGILSASEGVGLGFCAGVLAMSEEPTDRPYVLAATRICLKSQDPTGCWPLGRVVPQNKDTQESRLEIPTYQIASVLCEVLRSLVDSSAISADSEYLREALAGIGRAEGYVESSIVSARSGDDQVRGWCSDRPYMKPMLESWTSAAVLEEMVSAHILLDRFNCLQVLSSFRHSRPGAEDWPSWLSWQALLKSSEPDSRAGILNYLNERLVRRIQESGNGLPSGSERTVSVLLFGPPGTSKTTIAQGVAQALDWPIVWLSPGVFIERGLEYIEAEARSVFDRLGSLTSAVILFDECDELFRNREPMPEVEQTRGIAAFVTASMLPKLQDLHDKGRSIFFVCTNNFATLDPAMKRGGRIDHIVAVGPPDMSGRRRIIDAQLGPSGREHTNACADALAAATERFVRQELIRACDMLAEEKDWATAEEARNAARLVAERMRDSIMIGEEKYREFLDAQKQYSHPHLEDTQ